MKKSFIITLVLSILLTSCKDPVVEPGTLQLISVSVGTEQLSLSNLNEDFPFDRAVVIRFSQALNTTTVEENVSLQNEKDEKIAAEIALLDNDKTISILPDEDLEQKASYSIVVGENLLGKNNETFPGFTLNFTTMSLPLEVISVTIDEQAIPDNGTKLSGVSLRPEIEITFSEMVTTTDLQDYTSLYLGSLNYDFSLTQTEDSVISLTLNEDLPDFRKITLKISEFLSNAIDKEFEAHFTEFYTQLDSTDKFARVSDEELLDLVQEQTFKYFWEFAHPVSGLNRERNTSDDNVTSGGSGFGIMAIPLGIERGYITRTEGIERLQTIVAFLGTADRFHGVWSHWLSGSTGKVNPFSSDDDGGDIVETSYVAMGLMTARQYLNASDTEESQLIDDINELLNTIEWDYYTQGENSITWHWSPQIGFDKNMKVRGWNEALITYVMAASSTTHTISKEIYDEGWARNGGMVNGNNYYYIKLPLGPEKGGPLFFEQYTFLGLDPTNLSDEHANYWEQAVNHTLINRAYCIANPKNYIGYSEDCWGLTASDGDQGYSAHSPTNDRGVITPTAALASIPFTPEESMDAMRFFYYKLGDKLWGPYGFYDAFNVTNNWYTTSNIAIDQGPILLMIENYRTGLLWDLFMSAPEIQTGLTKLGFSY